MVGPRTLGLLAMLWLAACPKSQNNPDDDAMNAALVAADAAWAARGQGGLPAVTDALDTAPESRAMHPEVLWRRARVAVAQGMIADTPRDARRAYAQARGVGVSCLEGEPTVARALAIADVGEAARRVSRARWGCAAWTGVAWVRWEGTFEPGAADVDIQGIGALLAKGASEADPVRGDAVAWAQALWAHALVLRGQGDPGRARAQLLDVARRDENAWVRHEDVLRLLGPELAGAPPRRPPNTPEERAAAARLERGVVAVEP